ncbi:MAG: hypothetical protein VB071_14680 [Lawsonibacter sp.]|nr:hypothetical protein [Lawsonibacter sp.]
MGAYLAPVLALLGDLFRLPEERRMRQDLELRTKLYQACIREGRDPYADPRLMSHELLREPANRHKTP